MTTPLQVQMQRHHMTQTTTMILAWASGALIDDFDYAATG